MVSWPAHRRAQGAPGRAHAAFGSRGETQIGSPIRRAPCPSPAAGTRAMQRSSRHHLHMRSWARSPACAGVLLLLLVCGQALACSAGAVAIRAGQPLRRSSQPAAPPPPTPEPLRVTEHDPPPRWWPARRLASGGRLLQPLPEPPKVRCCRRHQPALAAALAQRRGSGGAPRAWLPHPELHAEADPACWATGPPGSREAGGRTGRRQADAAHTPRPAGDRLLSVPACLLGACAAAAGHA